MSKARSKGTEWESRLLKQLVIVWPTIARRGTTLGGNDDGDYLNCEPVLIEAKKVDSPRWSEWVRKMRSKAPDHRWLICWSGDARTQDGKPLAVMPLEFAIDLLHGYFGPWGHVARGYASAEITNPTFEEREQ